MASTPPSRRTAGAMVVASGISVSGLTSTSTGRRPAWMMAFTAPQNVIVDARTLAPRGSRRARRDNSIAAVEGPPRTPLRIGHDAEKRPSGEAPEVQDTGEVCQRHRLGGDDDQAYLLRTVGRDAFGQRRGRGLWQVGGWCRDLLFAFGLRRILGRHLPWGASPNRPGKQ